MDWIKIFCQLPPEPAPLVQGAATAFFLPTSIPLGETVYMEARLGPNTVLLRPFSRRRDLAGPFSHLSGHCWLARIPELAWCGENHEDDLSPLWLLEDGRPLGPAQTPHQDVARKGGGRFSHWTGSLFFSSRDNTDPNTNRRRYQIALETRPERLGLSPGAESGLVRQNRSPDALRTLEYNLGPGWRMDFGAESLAVLELVRPRLAVDPSPCGGIVWPNRNFLRRLGFERLCFRQGLEWREISLADSALTMARTLAGRAAMAAGRALGAVFRAGPAGRAAQRIVAAGAEKYHQAPGPAPQRRAEDMAASFGMELGGESKRVVPGSPLAGGSLKISHYIGGLGPGGGERELAWLAAAQARGQTVRVLTTYEPLGRGGYYKQDLEDAGVAVRAAGSCASGEILRKMADYPKLRRGLFPMVPVEFRGEVSALLAELVAVPPDVLCCWLDQPNIIGGVAGVLAGVPRVTLSVHNAAPSRFPHFYQPWLKPWYRALSLSPGIRISAVSRNVADDFRHWAGVGSSCLRVVRNGLNFDVVSPPSQEERAAFRAGLGLAPDEFVVAGVFRLAPEKRVPAFLEVMKRVLDRGVKARAVIAGDGPLAGNMEAWIRDYGLEGSVFPLGLRRDVYGVMGSCDALLLTSETEGLAIVLLEAQYLGLPVVTTDVGGIPEAVLRDRSGFLHQVDDIGGMAQSLARLAEDRSLARGMGREGRAFVEREFSLDHLYQQAMDLILEN